LLTKALESSLPQPPSQPAQIPIPTSIQLESSETTTFQTVVDLPSVSSDFTTDATSVLLDSLEDHVSECDIDHFSPDTDEDSSETDVTQDLLELWTKHNLSSSCMGIHYQSRPTVCCVGETGASCFTGDIHVCYIRHLSCL